jgi:hypothetical protein
LLIVANRFVVSVKRGARVMFQCTSTDSHVIAPILVIVFVLRRCYFFRAKSYLTLQVLKNCASKHCYYFLNNYPTKPSARAGRYGQCCYIYRTSKQATKRVSEVEKVCIAARTPRTKLLSGTPVTIQWYDNAWKLTVECGRRK